jgi:prepilin-type N-terminal cleavage/methylation domain-containing protein/prepilin-type processing-associated H-X9-DG protein
MRVAALRWPPTRRKSAFSLVELLVAVGIVAVLASLVLTGAWHARGRARALQCVTNLHELGVAIALYVRDYDNTMPLVYPMDYYPPHNPPKPPPPPPASWDVASVALGDYIRAPETFVCPTAGKRYGFNDSVSGMHVPPLPNWAGPADTLLMYDEMDMHMYGPHFGWGNMAFLDGHVKAYRPMPPPAPPAPNLAGAY